MPTPSQDGDFKISPPYQPALELIAKADVPAGQLHDFIMKSQESQIYPGIRGPYQRKVCVYIPKQYTAGSAAPFLIAQDGIGYRKTLPTILDNLIASKKLPVMIAILINSGGGDAQGSERGLEYDTLSDRYSTFVESEVLPRIEKDLSVSFTKDPDGRATMGGSSGGAAAFTMAWFCPERYHRVLTYSGTYVNQQSPLNPQSPHGAWEYHEHLIPQSETKPLRVWLEVGEEDIGAKRTLETLHNWPLANERMAAALKAKGYHYQFVFAVAGRHVDGKVVSQTLPEALEWLWAGYLINAGGTSADDKTTTASTQPR